MSTGAGDPAWTGRSAWHSPFCRCAEHDIPMPRKRDRDAPRVVHRTARCGLRVTRAQRERLFGLLRSAGDVWCCVLELNRWRRHRQDPPLAGLPGAMPGTDRLRPGHVRRARQRRGEVGAAPVLRRLVRRRETPQGRRRVRAVPAAQAGPGPGPLVRGHVHPGRAGAAHPGREGPPAAAGPAGPRRPLPGRAGPVGDPRVRRRAAVPGRDRRGPRRHLPARADTRPGPGGRAWTWASSTPTPSPDRAGSSCWYPGGPSAPSAGSTCATARAAPAPPPAAHPSPASAGRGGGGSTAAASARPRPGTGGGSARPSTRPPRPSCPGRSSAGSGRWRSATPAAC